MSFSIELILGYGCLAIVCERCGAAVPALDGGVCPKCDEELEDVPPESLEERDDDA